MEKWGKAWLNYKYIEDYSDSDYFTDIYYNDENLIIKNAVAELETAISALLDISTTSKYLSKQQDNIKVGVMLKLEKDDTLGNEGFHIYQTGRLLYIKANQPIGILYGVFHLIRLISCNESLGNIDIVQKPSNPYRLLNHWDNSDGSIERGYAGKSIFFEKEHILVNDRTKDYARLVASVGINGIVINNVNVKAEATYFITKKHFPQLKKMADLFEMYGVKLFLSLNYAAPVEMGDLETADPLDPGVKLWWEKCSKELFEYIPNFGGFLVKADSEGRPGPFTYNRTHAEGANMLAEAVKPYGGIIIWRCFVYNCKQDWRDKKTDRARAGYDHFKPLDGEFAENVILQIKNGPMDFQVREPVSPLFGGLKNTNQMLEFQITQEYTGQQKHVCYLVPMWKEVLSFKTYCSDKDDTVADIISGKTFGETKCGIAAVANVGNDKNWTGHDLAAANLYGFGRISWDTTLSSEDIANEWICMTFSLNPKVIENIKFVLMNSWRTYENYTSPLGIGWMVNPGYHYGPNVDGYEYDRWGTYHRADHKGIGVERGINGTAYVSQYNEPNASMYEQIETCPEQLLLFFHYVTYSYVLKTGKTLIQHIYDTHFEGVSDVEQMINKWEELEKLIEQESYNHVYSRLMDQLSSAKDWRDIINSYFFRKSGIGDEKQRMIY
jgi:alpha-glucuronidase